MTLPATQLVLLPGLDGTGELFREFAKALPSDFRTISVHYPTDRYLPIEQAEVLIDSAVDKAWPFVLVAESYSTPIAIRYAAANPARLRGLVLCAGFATSPVRGWLRSVCSLLAPLLFRLPLPRSVVRLLLIGPGADASLVAEIQVAARQVAPRVLASRLRAVLTGDALTDLSRVAVPVLYIQAGQDRLVPSSSFDEMREECPEVALTVIPGPHLLIQREPIRVAEVVARFVANLG